MTRRFSDFLGLYSKLHEKHIKTGIIVPPAPEKSVLGKVINRCDDTCTFSIKRDSTSHCVLHCIHNKAELWDLFGEMLYTIQTFHIC